MNVFVSVRRPATVCLVALASIGWLAGDALAVGPTAAEPYAWYRADVGVTYDAGSGLISAWADQSGNGRDLGVLGTPYLNADGLIETDTGALAIDADAGFTPAAGTVFAVFSMNAQPPGSSFVYNDPSGGPNQHMGNEDPGDNQGSSFGDVASWGGGSIYGYNFPREAEDALKVSAASYTGGGATGDFLTIRDLEGSLLINETGNCESSGMNGIVIGATQSGGTMYHNLEGVVAEVLVYEGDLDSTEITQIEDILTTRWYSEIEPSNIVQTGYVIPVDNESPYQYANHPVPLTGQDGWDPSGNDLINTGSAAYVSETTTFEQETPDFLGFPDPALRNGTAVGLQEVDLATADADAVFDDTGWEITYTLNTATSPDGYDITEIDTYAAGPAGRANEEWELLVEYVNDPGNFVSLDSYALGTDGQRGGTRIQLTALDGIIASGVSAVQFAIQDQGLDPFYREFDVIGHPTGAQNTPGDFNGDGNVDTADYTIWADNYTGSGGSGGTPSTGDANGDDAVDTADYTIWADNYTGSSAAAGTVPEPGTISLLLIGLAGLVGYARRKRG